MTKRLASKHKITRRFGVNLWGNTKSSVNKRDTTPGQHGAMRKKKSDYGVQLAAKQKLKGYYGNIGERQFRRYYQEAVRRKGDTSENLVELLERRLDIIVYRLGFVPTVFAARQFVSHGHVMVNKKRVNIPSYLIKDGDQVSVKESSQKIAFVIEAQQQATGEVPEYLEVDIKDLSGRFIRGPKFADIPYPVEMEPNLVIEFYSR